ncbi:hypothetical protein [Streptomyces sp. NBC_00203]|uniref:hypothetical protein n=1 Tax=Streptomyces sp. NBC_00203 TaxID=2975680 RepID=UPI003244D53E
MPMSNQSAHPAERLAGAFGEDTPAPPGSAGLVVAVVGSFRQHYAHVVHAAEAFVAAGITVGSPSLSKIVNPGEEFARFASDPPQVPDHHIQAATLEKIFTSDFVYVVAPGGYIGRTTSYELGRIHERGIPTYYSEMPKDLPIGIPQDLVRSAACLAARLGTSAPSGVVGPALGKEPPL